VAWHVYSGFYSNFLFDNERQRRKAGTAATAEGAGPQGRDIWADLCSEERRAQLANALYDGAAEEESSGLLLLPRSGLGLAELRLWPLHFPMGAERLDGPTGALLTRSAWQAAARALSER